MWIVKDSIISFKGTDSVFIPSAIQIFDNVFSDKDTPNENVSDLPSIEQALPEIDFQSYVASLSLHIVPFSEYLEDGLKLEIIAKLDGEHFNIPMNVITSSVDHAVVERTWIPLQREQMELMNGKFKYHHINFPKISLKQYLILKNDTDLYDFIDDRTGMLTHASSFSPKQTFINIKGLNATLYPYQEKGVAWLNSLSKHDIGVILGDEMGLGKTLQIISLILLEKQSKRDQVTLIVLPASLIENWRREFQKFAPELVVYIHHGNYRSVIQKVFFECDVVLTTYDLVIHDLYLLKNISWNLLILDEGHLIRNPDAQRTKAVKELNKRMGILVTGTPLVNKLTDLWSITDFTNKEYLGTKEDFDLKYPYSTESAERLEKKISPILLRREVKTVADDLPDKIIIPQWIRFGQDESLRYENLLQSTLSNNKPSFASLVYLRMYCCHPLLVDSNYNEPIEHFSKFIRLLEVLEEIVDNAEKVLIFTDFVDGIDILDNEIASRFGIYTNKIYGKTPMHMRQTIIDDFTKVRGAGCLVLNYTAAGVGLNLQAANHVILYNPVWNPADEDQAIARSYRRGQEKPVRIHRFCFVDSIEELMETRIVLKRDVIESAVDGVEGDEADIQKIWKQLSKHR